MLCLCVLSFGVWTWWWVILTTPMVRAEEYSLQITHGHCFLQLLMIQIRALIRNLIVQKRGQLEENTKDWLISTADFFLRVVEDESHDSDVGRFNSLRGLYRWLIGMTALHNLCSVHVREDRGWDGRGREWLWGEKTNQCYQIPLFRLHLTLITSPKSQCPNTDTLG